jgi:hypothetical protein
MNVKTNDMAGMILRGARVAYELDRAPESASFEKWLAEVFETGATNGHDWRSESLAALCQKAYDNKTAKPLDGRSAKERDAVIVALRAFEAMVEINRLGAHGMAINS